MATATSLSAMDALGNARTGAQKLFGPKQEEGMMGELNAMCNLTYSQRMYGFAACFVLGTILSIISAFFITQPVKFAVLYSIGNVIALISTSFLLGPCTQLKYMFHRKRLVATILYLVMIVVTVLVAVLTQNEGLTFLCIIVQYLALTWYALSYIPFARDMAKRCCGSVMSG